MKTVAGILTAIMLSKVALAITWSPSQKTDPLTGEKVPAKMISTYGSYVYKSPSKYDLVFWPLTDRNWICMNPKNGYAAFNDDFERLPDKDKKKVADWLKKNYKPEQAPASHKEKLAWLEKVYRQREMDSDFWCRFYRLMAYAFREDEKTSLAYVKKAVPLLDQKLKSNPDGVDKLELLYLLGEYQRRLGENNKAQEYFAQIKDVKYKEKAGNEQVGHPFFVELVEDRRKLLTEEPSSKADAGDGK